MVLTLSDEQLELHGPKLKDAVAIVTGGGNGIGKETALKLAHYGAKVVIADLNLSAAEKAASEIVDKGGDAIALACDVTSFEEQVSIFEAALAKYGSVDVVIANAGISEAPGFVPPTIVDGMAKEVKFLTLEVNLIGALYTVYLAQHYLLIGHASRSGSPKSIVILSSISGYTGIAGGPQYGGAKAGLIGLVRSLHQSLGSKGVRISAICPYFAATGIVSVRIQAMMAGVPMVSVPRIALAIVDAAANTDLLSNGSTYFPLDHGSIHVFSHTEVLSPDVYSLLSSKCLSLSENAATPASQEESGPAPTIQVKDQDLLRHLERAKGAVVFISGAASALGKASALKFSQLGAKLALVDVDTASADAVVAEITASGGQALALKADPSSYDEQQAAFQAAAQAYGSVDVVIVGGVPIDGDMAPQVMDSKVSKPDFVNLYRSVYGLAHTLYLAQVYLNMGRSPNSTKPKAIVSVSHAAVWQSIPGPSLYTTAMLTRLGITRCLYQPFALGGIHTGIVASNIDAPDIHQANAASALVAAALDPDMKNTGAGFFIGGDGSTQMVRPQNITAGVYREMGDRISRAWGFGR